MSFIEFVTQDNKKMKVDKRIVNFSELFNTLHENFETELGSPLAGIKEAEMNLLIKFCEACEYTPITFEKPIWKKTFKNCYFAKISKNKKLEKFYNDLNYDKLCTYFKISYFYDSTPLKEFLYFKIYDIFNDEQKCIEYLDSKDKDIIKKAMEIDDNKRNYLYNKYQKFIQKQLEALTPQEINDYCLQCYP